MPRTTPADRARKVVEVAATVFVDLGYRRAQMDDVADRLGVSKGTLYRSVPSKEALLAAVLTHGDHPADLAAGGGVDVIPLAEVAERLPRRLSERIATLELARVAVGTATAARSGDEVAEQVERMARELFETMAHHRVTIMVLDRCAAEVPELAGWFDDGRYAVVDLWESYLDSVGDHLGGAIDRSVLARTIVELITLWAVKMPWDPAPRPYPSDLGPTCAGLVAGLVTGARA
jgi:AcrR family transcriptional regulator